MRILGRFARRKEKIIIIGITEVQINQPNMVSLRENSLERFVNPTELLILTKCTKIKKQR